MNNKKIEKVKVLYIAGPSRSGSTILSQILGGIPGFFNAGELLNIWDRGIKNQGVCSCGNYVNTCSIWGKVTQEVTQNPSFQHVDVLIELRNKLARSSKVPFNFNKKLSQVASDDNSRRYLENLVCLYRSIAKTTGCKVLVDSSKNLGYAYYVAKIGIIDLYLVHLIRDSRATAYSWMKKKGDLFKLNPFNSSKTWSSRNLVAEIIGRQMKDKYLRLLYENFVQEPKNAVRDIVLMLKEDPELADVPFVSAHEVRLNPSHLIYGNPDRFKSGIIRLKYDAKWKQMRRRDKLIVTALTWPFLIKYNYPIFNDK
jgi:hypothetical protein